MALETATYISQLVSANPTHADGVNQGDAHERLIKTVLQNQFPNLGAAAVTGTAAQLNALLALLPTQGLATAIAPMGTVHTFARDPGATLCARGGTGTGTEQFILLDGSSYASSKYPALAASSYITVSGSNFSVDNLVTGGRFIRCTDGTSPGTTQANQNASHTHGLTDNGHTHGLTDNGHAHTASWAQTGASVNIADGGTLGSPANAMGVSGTPNIAGYNVGQNPPNLQISGNVSVSANTTGISVNGATTGISVNSSGGSEARPNSIYYWIAIKT